MASTLSINKVSGVLSFSVDGLAARRFFGATGNYQPDTAGTNIVITVGNYQSVSPALQVSVPYTGLTVNGQTPPNMTTALTLLNAVFSS